MYTHEPTQPVGCHTYNEGWHNCNACAFRDDPLGCDGFTVTEGAKVTYGD